MELHTNSQTNSGKLSFDFELPGSGGEVDKYSGVDGPCFRVSVEKPWIGVVAGTGGFALEWEDWPSFAVCTAQFGCSINYIDPTNYNEIGFSGLPAQWNV